MSKKSESRPADLYSASWYHEHNFTNQNFSVESYKLNNKWKQHATEKVRFLYIIDGHGEIDINGTLFTLKENTLLWLFPYHISSILTSNHLEIIEFSFSLHTLMHVSTGKLSDVKSRHVMEELLIPVQYHTLETAQQLKQLFQNAYLEYQQKEPFYEMSLYANLNKTVVLFQRMAVKMKHSSIRKGLAWELLQYIYFNFSKNLTSDQLSQQFDVSIEVINNELRQLTGKNFSENLSQVRFQNADAMLHFSGLPISYIAKFVGFSSVTTFQTLFKQKKGMTPKEFQFSKNHLQSLPTDAELAYDVYCYMNLHYDRPLTLNKLAEHFHCTKRKIETTLLSEFDVSYTQLLGYVRSLYARNLVATTKNSFQKIAEIVGFQTIRSFNRAFLKYLGTTPSLYRKLAQQKNMSHH